MSSDDYHVYPLHDVVEHDTEAPDCVCGPKPRPQKADDGSVTWILVHHSLDGRELNELSTGKCDNP